jgi:heme oxygenase
MTWNRITRVGAARRALLPLVIASNAIAALGGCGGGGTTTTTVPDTVADAELLNAVLARQLAVVRAYERTLPLLRGAALERGREFRADEQEHSNAIVRALRRLGEEATPEEEEVESEDLETQADALEFLYEVENASIAYDLKSIAKLTSSTPRALLASIAANQAQHLVVLRRALGATAAESIPEAFEDGGTPSPSEMIEE